MNVAFVNATRRFGGVKAWTLDAARTLARLGHRPILAARPGPFLDAARAAGLDARAWDFGMDYGPLGVARFLRLFREEKTEVVVCNVGKDLRLAGVAARLAGIPVVHRVGLPRDMRDSLKVRLTHRFLRPRLLAPCAYIARDMAAELSFVAEADVTVIPTGKEPAPAAPERANAPRIIVTTSQLNPDKGHADLLEALARLAGQGRDFRCRILGAGSAESELKARAQRLGLGERMAWPGFVSDVRTELARADLFALPSRSEGLPNALLEAMAEGLLPVARDVGGVAEAWPTGLDRFLLPYPAGVEELAAALDAALSLDDAALLAARRAVWEHMAANFSLEAQTRTLAQWLGQVAQEARRGR
ncbi:MAG: glycosyltransferase [Thermodesulfobacteriota bacterium]